MSVWGTKNLTFDLYNDNFDVNNAEVMCDCCNSIFEWTDKEKGSGDEIPICSVNCYNTHYDKEEHMNKLKDVTAELLLHLKEFMVDGVLEYL